MSDASELFELALIAKKAGHFFPPGGPEERVIASSFIYSYRYARDILEGPFPLGERAISKDDAFSYEYAKYVLKGPFPKGEKAIATDGFLSFCYAFYILEAPFPLGERAISKGLSNSYRYATEVIRGRWPLGEERMMQDEEVFKDYRTYLSIIGELPPEWEGLGIHDGVDLLRSMGEELDNFYKILYDEQ